MTEPLHPPTPLPRPRVGGRRRGPGAPRLSPGGRRREASRRTARPRLVAALALVLALSASLGALAAPAPASAQPSPTPGAPAPAPGGPTLGSPTPVPGPLSISSPGPQTSNTVTVSGGGAPDGSRVHVVGPGGVTVCRATSPSADGAWSCAGQVANGADQPLTARLEETTTEASATVSVLGPPTVQGGALVLGRVSGTAEPGARVSVGAVGRAPVTGTADGGGAWSVLLPGAAWPSGSYDLRVTQSTSAVPAVPVSGAAAARVTVDRTAPAAPAITAPTAGSRLPAGRVTVSGTGESGATVTVYVDGTAVCQSPVAAGAWSCTTDPLPSGRRTLQAAQVDPAGNQGPPGTGVGVLLDPRGAATDPPGTAGPTPGPTDGAAPPAVPAPTPTEGTAPDDGAPLPGGPGPGSDAGQVVPAPDDGTGTTPSGWAWSTGFGDGLPDPRTATSGGTPWAVAALLALAFLLVVVLPSRLVSGLVRDRRRSALHLTGRNRSRDVPSSIGALRVDPRAGAALAVAGAAAAVALAVGVDGQVRYARLAVAVAVGLAVLNIVCVVLPAWLVARRHPSAGAAPLRTVVRVSPLLLVAAGTAALGTRLLSLDPPLVLGVVLTAGVALRPVVAGTVLADDRAPAGARRAVALAQVAALVVVPLGAWLAHQAVGAQTGFWHQLGREALATTCLAGLTSLVVALVPVGHSPGRVLWGWHAAVHLGTSVVAVGVAALVVVGPDSTLPVGPAVLAAGVGAVVAVAAWVWTHWVDPTARPS